MGNRLQIILGAAFISLGCNGTPAQVDPSFKSNDQDLTTPSEGPEGEMMPGAMSPSIGDEPPQPLGKIPKKTDKQDLLNTATQALKRKDLTEAISFSDVILLLYPNDNTALEIRGRALILQGDKEDGLTDLKKCCKNGHITCCKP